MRKTLEKKERSLELNNLDRILVDFKSLLDSNGYFFIYKLDGTIYYIFDVDGFFMMSKSSGFTFVEEYLGEDEHFRIKYDNLKEITKLKKSEVTNIYLDGNYYFETVVDGVFRQHIFIKNKDDKNILKNLVLNTSKEKLEREYIKATYDAKRQILIPENADSKLSYPYKITFSDDINFKLKIDDPSSVYYIRPLNDGAFLQVVTLSDYKEIYKAQSMLFVFNYLNKKEV